MWEQIRDHQEALAGVLAWGGDNYRLGRGTEARDVRGLLVSGRFFTVLGVPPLRGRLLGPEDDRRGCGPSGVVISYGLWQREFGGRDSAIGSKLVVLDQPFEVIGVTPPEFFGLEVGRSFDVAMPICTQALWSNTLERRDVWWLTVMGRLKPGETVGRASAQMNAISAGLFAATEPSGYAAASVKRYLNFRLEALRAGTGVSRLREEYDRSLWLLLGITGLVLLIACANLANLMLARASAREREIAVRLALGASPGRLVRQLLAESLLLAAAGAALGVFLASELSAAMVWALATGGDALHLDLRVDWRVLGFTAAVAAATCAVFGLAPALRSSRAEPGAAMKTGGRGLTAGRERFSFQRLLVVSQIAVSLVLLVGALLFVRSLRNLVTFDPGFREKDILIAYVSFYRLHVPEARRELFQRDLLERVRAIPLVESAATTTNVPLSGSSWTLGVRRTTARGEQTGSSKFTWVSPGYLRTMDVALLAGRDFDGRDTATARRVAVVNQTFVRRFLGGANPIGAVLRTVAEPNYPEAEYEIVGVVQDTKYAGLREPRRPSPSPPRRSIRARGRGRRS